MFFTCLCAKNKQSKRKGNDSALNQSKQRFIVVDNKEKQLLQLIFEDLANRNPNQRLNHHNFALFISLTGLWGDKLFKSFTTDGKQEINFAEFLTGIVKTVKGEKDEKVKILFNFIKHQKSEGIRYDQFLKMLYHYSKPELKQMMVNDGVFVHQSIIPPTQELVNKKKQIKEGEVIHLKRSIEKQVSINENQNQNPYSEAFQNMMKNYHDPGTQFVFKTEKLTYKVDYCNMNHLTKQYASHIFMNFGINEKLGSMNLDNFNKYLSNNTTLFNTYFKTFHQNLWGVTNKIPNFLQFIEKQKDVFIISNKNKQPAYLILSGHALFFAVSKTRKTQILKIIWMEGISVKKIDDQIIEIRDVPNQLTSFQLQFEDEEETNVWMKILKDYEKKFVLSKYDIKEAIGTGRFSIVYRAKQRQGSQRTVALKILNTQKLDKKMKKSIEHQTEIMRILKCPWFIQHYETIYSHTNLIIATEYIKGEDLFEYVKKYKRLEEKEAAFLLLQIIYAVMELHEMEIIHRDLKPENIMIAYRKEDSMSIQSSEEEKTHLSFNKTSKPRIQSIKLIDFGFANYQSVLQTHTQNSPVGTLNYMAPQTLLGEKSPTFQNDTFAIGSILYFMLRGKYAFDSSDPKGTALRTVTGDYNLYDQIWEEVSDEAKDLVEWMLKVNPDERITLKEALNHQWFVQVGLKVPNLNNI